MTSLTEVYDGGVGTVIGRRRRLLGSCLFVAGAAMVVGAIPLATTDLAGRFGLGVYEARELAGVLAGLGLPAVFVGIFAVLPTSSATRAAAAIGASLAVFGVALFWYAYPQRWLSNDPTFALATIGLYSAGTLVTFWCLFAALATFKTRNDPGGTARIEITEEGQVRVINAGPATTDSSGSRPSIPGFGSVGLFGNDPDGSVPTQTNGREQSSKPDPELTDDGVVMTRPTGDDAVTSDGGDGAVTSDGGDGAVTGDSPPADAPGVRAEVLEASDERGQPDRYCGNCTHFRYVRADGDLEPYCGFHHELMDDMDACENWEQRETDSLPR